MAAYTPSACSQSPLMASSFDRVVEDTLGVILKYQEDVDRVAGEVAGKLVDRAVNAAAE